MVFFHFMSLYITTGYYVVSLRKKLFILFIGTGMLFDKLLNWELLYAFEDKGPYWFVGCGTYRYNNPDPYVEQYAFVYITVVGYFAIHGLSFRFYERSAMTMILGFLATSQIQLGYSTPRQVILRATVGTVEGVAFLLAGFYVFIKYAKQIKSLWIVKLLEYKNTIIIPDKEIEENAI